MTKTDQLAAKATPRTNELIDRLYDSKLNMAEILAEVEAHAKTLERELEQARDLLATPPADGEWAKRAAPSIVHDIETLTRCWIEKDEEEKAIAIVERSLLKHAPAPSDGADKGRLAARLLPIDESGLLLLGFYVSTGEFNRSEFAYSLTIEDASSREWANITLNRGNGSDETCWDVRFVRQDGNNMRPVDRVVLKYGARTMGEVIDLIRAIDYRAAIDSAIAGEKGGAPAGLPNADQRPNLPA